MMMISGEKPSDTKIKEHEERQEEKLRVRKKSSTTSESIV
jgi:hypothetical protein